VLHPFLCHIQKLIQWFIQLTVRAKTLSLLENLEVGPNELGLGKIFLDMMPKAQMAKKYVEHHQN
jgi:hypothetical protein